MHPPTIATTVMTTLAATVLLGCAWAQAIMPAELGEWRPFLGGAAAAPFGLVALCGQLVWRAWYLRQEIYRRSIAMRRAIYFSGPAALAVVLCVSLCAKVLHPGN
jgi:hypothetical protein